MRTARTYTALYTRHGKKRLQGIPLRVNGRRVLGYCEGERLVGYTTLEELLQMFYRDDLPEMALSDESGKE